MAAKRSEAEELHAAPIRWLGVVGPVPAIDARSAGEAEAGHGHGHGHEGVSGAAVDPRRTPSASEGGLRRLHLRVVGAKQAVEEERKDAFAPPSPVEGEGGRGGEVLASSTPTVAAAAAKPAAAAAPAKSSKPEPGFFGRLFKKKKRSGSGLEARTSIRALQWIRRLSQSAFFLLFMYWLVNTAFRGSFTSTEQNIRIGKPVEGFLLADPFVALITLLSTHTLYRGLLWSLGLVGLTLVFGRVFCGWICPFGTLHHFLGWLLPSRQGMGARRVEANRTKKWQRLKYYLLYAFLAAAATGVVVGGVFDPICVMVRGVGLSVLPATQWVSSHVLGLVSGSSVRVLQNGADHAQDVLSTTVFQTKQYYFHQAWFIGALFVAILFMNRIIPRFWCRALCPLGALLGVMAKYAVFGMEKDHAKCTDCNLCIVHCQGADSPQGGVKWRQDECHMCLNCENACPEDVIKFRFLPNRQSRKTDLVPERRTALASVAAGAAFYVLHRQTDASAAEVNYASRAIRPPGSVEEHAFLERCIRCAECMKVCPNNALHPAFMEAGVEGMWTPILIPRIGYCENSCVLCGDVCPTGAIQKISEVNKQGKWKPGLEGKEFEVAPIKLGTAFYDKGRCLPWSMATPCIVCEEFCPTSPKAIYTIDEVVIGRGGKEVKVQKPQVDPSLCVGCGACEKVCPVVDQPAVYVTSVGETRSKTNVILLENTSYNQKT
jgi:polyferredoxin/ferredoxin